MGRGEGNILSKFCLRSVEGEYMLRSISGRLLLRG